MEHPTDPLAVHVAARKQRKSLGRLRRLVRSSVTLVWASGRRAFSALVALQVVAGVALALQVLSVQSVLTAVLSTEQGGSPRAAIPPVLLLAGLTALTAVVAACQTQLQRVLGELVARTVWGRVLRVATGVNLLHFESPEFYDHLERVQTHAVGRPYQVTQGLLAIAGSTVASIGLGLALASFSPLLLVLVAVGGVPLLLTSRRESRLEFDFSVGQTPVLRERTYLTLIQTGRSEAKEVRAFGLGDWLRSRFDASYERYLAALRTHAVRRTALSVVGQLGSAAVLVGTLLVLVWPHRPWLHRRGRGGCRDHRDQVARGAGPVTLPRGPGHLRVGAVPRRPRVVPRARQDRPGEDRRSRCTGVVRHHQG